MLATIGVRGNIVEQRGVHLSIVFEPAGPVVRGSTHRVIISLQNCWNAARSVELDVRAREIDSFGIGRQSIVLEGRHKIELSPLEVGQLRLRLHVPPGAWGRFRVRPFIRITGAGGQRLVRTKRAEMPVYASPMMQLLYLAAGMFVWEEEGYFDDFKVPRQAAEAPVDVEIPEANTRGFLSAEVVPRDCAATVTTIEELEAIYAR